MNRQSYERHKQALTANERAVCDLSVRGLSQRTIALALGISRSAVQSRLENAARKLRKALDQEAA